MNEELQTALVEMVTKLSEASDWTVEQAPEVLRELLAWGMIDAQISLAIAGAASGVGIYLWRLVRHLNAEGGGAWSSDGDKAMLAGIAATVLNLVGAVVFFCAVHQICMITFAPKVYLLKEASSLVRLKR